MSNSQADRLEDEFEKWSQAALAKQQASPEARTTERHIALREGHRIKGGDDYFAARTQVLEDDGFNRSLFDAGFDRGFDAAEKVYPAAPPSAPQRDLAGAVPGLGRLTVHGNAVELQFVDEHSAEAFMEQCETTVDVSLLPAQQVREQAALPVLQDRFYNALTWALGANGAFSPQGTLDGKYWWRGELAERAGLTWDGMRYVPALAQGTTPAAGVGEQATGGLTDAHIRSLPSIALRVHDLLHRGGFRRQEDWFIRRDPNDDDSAECIHIDTIRDIVRCVIATKPSQAEPMSDARILEIWGGLPYNCGPVTYARAILAEAGIKEPIGAEEEVTAAMLRAAQLESELGADVCSNMAGAYDLITELYTVMHRAGIKEKP